MSNRTVKGETSEISPAKTAKMDNQSADNLTLEICVHGSRQPSATVGTIHLINEWEDENSRMRSSSSTLLLLGNFFART